MRPLDIHDPSQPDPNPRTGITSIECWNLKNNVIAPNPDFDNYEYQNQTSDKAKRTAYGFDHLFFPVSKTVEIYNGAVKGIVAAALEGYHGSVFAYGQTATGKTFTMQGTADEVRLDEERWTAEAMGGAKRRQNARRPYTTTTQ
jgi:protein tyrosine phosphatase (PTP) superfamily phosphohydrolase (DUF442 family)